MGLLSQYFTNHSFMFMQRQWVMLAMGIKELNYLDNSSLLSSNICTKKKKNGTESSGNHPVFSFMKQIHGDNQAVTSWNQSTINFHWKGSHWAHSAWVRPQMEAINHQTKGQLYSCASLNFHSSIQVFQKLSCAELEAKG